MDFTELYGDSTPYEVGNKRKQLILPQMMMMLNSYYKMLDDSVGKYSLYKVRDLLKPSILTSR